MAKKRKNNVLQIRFDDEWIAEVSKEADFYKMPIAAYLRLAAIEKMQRDRAERENDYRKKK